MKRVLIFIILIIGLYYHPIFSQWVKLNTGVNYRFTKAFFVNEDVGFVSCLKYDSSFLFKTTDGGSNWQVLLTNNYKINNVMFFNENTGYGIGQHIYKTTDGGFNWTLKYNVGFKTTTDIQFLDTNNGYVTYTNDEQYSGIYRTTNAGVNWVETQYIGTAGIIDCVNFLDINNGYVGGWEPIHGPGTIYFTTNAGVNWYHNVWLVGPPVVRLDFLNYDTAFAFQKITQGSIFYTLNSGTNWHVYSLPLSILDYKAFSFDTMIIVGLEHDSLTGFNFNSIFKTTDKWVTWKVQYRIACDTGSFYNCLFRCMFFVNRKVGYLAGDSGYVLKTTNGGDPIGIRETSGDVPEKFSIFQNYPNPFNPSTVINYQLPVSNNVKLVIYDILGREVATLVNEKQQPGKYQVTWDASNFASGVYFYTLKTDNFSETKKMLMIK